MKRIISIMSFMFSAVLVGSTIAVVFAQTNDNPPPYEKIYSEVGYKSIEDALKRY